MTSRALILLLSFVATAIIAIAVVAHLIHTPGHGSCAYGSGDRMKGCKSRPEPQLAEFAAAIDGSALAAGLEALRNSPDASDVVMGVGLNRWGETSFTLPVGDPNAKLPKTRIVRFDRAGQPLPENAQARYADVIGSAPFPLAGAQPRALREAVGRADRAERFSRADLESSFGHPGMAWRLSYASHRQADVQPATYAMGAAGEGLCRMDNNAVTPRIPACNYLNLPSTPFAAIASAGSNAPAMTTAIPAPPPDPALRKSLDQMACVKAAQGNVDALRRCVE